MEGGSDFFTVATAYTATNPDRAGEAMGYIGIGLFLAFCAVMIFYIFSPTRRK